MGTWRKMFGPSKQEIWQQLSTEISGRFVDGGIWKGDRVVANHGEWTVTLDTFAVSTGKAVIVFTRMRAPYVNPDGFRFNVYPKGMFSDLAKKLGMQDVSVGFEPFDTNFIVKGTDESKLRALFSDPRLRELLSTEPELQLSVKDDEGWFGPKFGDQVDELYYAVPGILKDVERLKRLYALFGEALDQLCRIGSAYKEAPDVVL
jgi:hypothetical protein